MKRFLAVAAVALAPVVATSCNDYNNTFQPNTGAVVTFLSPADAFASGPAFTLTVNGGGFVDQTVVQWNGQNRTTTPVKNSSGAITALTAAITAADIANPGTAMVNTLSPHKSGTDNGLSNSLAFTIRPAGNPVPAITSISPATAVACGTSCADFPLTISGSNFLPSNNASGASSVRWNSGPSQTALAVTAATSTQVQATVPGSLIASTGTTPVMATVTVFNSPPGGGGSNGATFTFNNSGPVAGLGPQSAAEESPALSADGRYVGYVGGDGNHTQIFVRDTCTGAGAKCEPQTVLVSAAADGTAGNADSHSPSMSADGRYVAFSSAAANLVDRLAVTQNIDDPPPGRQVYLRDTCFGAASPCEPVTHLISIDPNGALSGMENILPSISSSGRFVAFLSITPARASRVDPDLVGVTPKNDATSTPAAPNSGYRQIFVRDTCLGAANGTPSTTRISLQPGDAPASGAPARPALSSDASHLAFTGRDATLFTRSATIDDRVFLAIIGNRH